MRHELFVHALRTPDLHDLARRQIDGYTRIVADWCQRAAGNAREVCSVQIDTLASAVVGNVMGIVLSYLSHQDRDRSRRDLQVVIEMLVALCYEHE